MRTIKCQYTGIEFETESNRRKNHPRVSELLNEAANKRERGAYHNAKGYLAECKAAGMDDIDEVIEYVEAQLDNYDENRKAEITRRNRERKAREKARREAKKERERTNAHLRKHGYNWRKVAVGTEEDSLPGSYGAGVGEFSHYEWRLYAPNGRVVSVERALDEIERGADVVAAEIEAERKAEAQEQQKLEAEQEAEFERRQAAFDEAKRHTEVEAFDYDGFEAIYRTRSDRVYKGKVVGVTCYVTYHYADYGNDYDESIRYWCENPDDAGLTPVERDEISQTLADFFGG